MSVRTTNNYTVIESISIAADGNAPSIDVSKYSYYSYQIVFDSSGGATSAGNIALQVSDNNAFFTTIASTVLAYTNTTVTHIIEVTSVGHQWSRINIKVTHDNTFSIIKNI
jgi:hypothetical protein